MLRCLLACMHNMQSCSDATFVKSTCTKASSVARLYDVCRMDPFVWWPGTQGRASTRTGLHRMPSLMCAMLPSCSPSSRTRCHMLLDLHVLALGKAHTLTCNPVLQPKVRVHNLLLIKTVCYFSRSCMKYFPHIQQNILLL